MANWIFYKDNTNCCWWEKDTDGILYKRPFGHYIFLLLNTINAQKDKETFVNSELYWASDNNNVANMLGLLDESGRISKEKLSAYYDESIANNEENTMWKAEFDLFIAYMKNLTQFRKSKTAQTDLLGIYTRFKYFATAVCSSFYEYLPATNNERNNFFDNIYTDLISFKGYSLIQNDKDDFSDAIPCEIYESPEMFNIMILDLWEFLFNPACRNINIHFCTNCVSMFVDSNNKSKYCSVCRQPKIMSKIRYKNRKSNKARKLHQEVLTLAYGTSKKSNDTSNAFLNESNYYWDVIQGKNPEKIQCYSNEIKTESDYIKWLEKKSEEFKKNK